MIKLRAKDILSTKEYFQYQVQRYCLIRGSYFNKLDRKIFLLNKLSANILKCTFTSSTINLTFNFQKKVIQIQLRKSTSDIEVFHQVFIEEEYSKTKNLLIKHFPNSIFTILDAGSNIGLAGIYLSVFFTNNRLIAIEPDPENYKACKLNFLLNNLEAEVKQLALTEKTKKLTLNNDFRDGENWSVSIKENSNGDIQGYSLSDLQILTDTESFDFIKIDIEGAEFYLLEEKEEFAIAISRTKAIVMEIHDDVGDRKDIYSFFNENNFKILELGELTMFMNKTYLVEK